MMEEASHKSFCSLLIDVARTATQYRWTTSKLRYPPLGQFAIQPRIAQHSITLTQSLTELIRTKEYIDFWMVILDRERMHGRCSVRHDLEYRAMLKSIGAREGVINFNCSDEDDSVPVRGDDAACHGSRGSVQRAGGRHRVLCGDGGLLLDEKEQHEQEDESEERRRGDLYRPKRSGIR